MLIHYSKVVSLSHPIDSQIPHWPGDPKTRFTPIAQWEQDGYFLRELTIGEHSATHVNAPRSFDPNGRAIADYPPEHWIRPAVCLDVRDRCDGNPDYQIQVADILRWERKYGEIPAGCVAIAFTGWQDKWSDPAEFLGDLGDLGDLSNGEDSQDLHFPGFGDEAAILLMNRRRVAGVAIDTHGVDPGPSETFGVNRLVLGQDGIVLECLTGLEQLSPTGAVLMISPLPLVDGSGSPAQVVAFLP